MIGNKIFSGKKRKIIIGICLLFIVLAGGYFFYQKFNAATKTVNLEEAKAIAEKFVNGTLLPPEMPATIKNVSLENDLYNITLEVAGKSYNSYLTKDGKKFFQSGIDIAEAEKESQNAAASDSAEEPSASATTKNDKPQVELFVMSHCPYGTQIEKGIIPALEALGNKVDFQLKFCSYAMHGKIELDEELTEYCIQKDNPGKLLSYLTCFLNNSDSAACLKQAGIDTTKLNSCIKATDSQYKVTEKFNDKSTWTGGNYPLFDIYKLDNEKYGVSGSPTLVINGSQISANRDSASLLSTICSGFNNKPEECNKVLSSTAPSAGFGQGTGTDTNSGCATQ